MMALDVVWIGRANGNRPLERCGYESREAAIRRAHAGPGLRRISSARVSRRTENGSRSNAEVSGHSESTYPPTPAPGEGLSARWQVSTAGGTRPALARRFPRNYYNRADGMVMAVPVSVDGNALTARREKPRFFQAFTRVDGQTMMKRVRRSSRSVIDTLGGDEAEPLDRRHQIGCRPLLSK
jgi:hypothetical protein